MRFPQIEMVCQKEVDRLLMAVKVVKELPLARVWRILRTNYNYIGIYGIKPQGRRQIRIILNGQG